MNRGSTSRRPSRAVTEAIIIVPVAVLVLIVAMRFDALDVLYQFSRAHEDWELDDIILTTLVIGAFGFVYAFHRVLDLNREVKLRRKAQDESAWLGKHDILTRLPNRHCLPDIFAMSESMVLSGNKQPAVVYSLDLNDFRRINNQFGPKGGDRVLVETAERLRQVAGREKVVRHGPDEFLVIAERGRITDPYHFAARILRAVSAPLQIDGVRTEISANIGYACFPEDAGTLEGTVRRAEFTMNRSRELKCVILAFDQAMEKTLHYLASLDRALPGAVRSNDIRPYYQPIVDLETGKVCSFEVLSRWHRDGEGFISPEVFIEAAERTGLIVELSERLLRQACRDSRTWPQDIGLSFNISATQLADRLLGMRVLKILAEEGFAPGRLRVEVTESALVNDPATAEAVLADFRRAGVLLAVDDFGTGYSSLYQLSRFDFDIVKIDRSFVDALESDNKQSRIVRAIIKMAEGLDLRTIAEGIERTSQSDCLRDLGCRHGQGFLFGQAMPAPHVQGYLAECDANRTAAEGVERRTA
ncbi:MAG: bifunctional diguanylate cyclase/phosphodiesterase [Pseudomonadota bacterium]|nr:bifunctional diguanylate cyclase/phosphodiesterase [Pseudomonadota bacterium]